MLHFKFSARSMSNLCYSYVLLRVLTLFWTLDYNEEVILVRGNHHIVLLARDAQESQVVLRVQVAH